MVSTSFHVEHNIDTLWSIIGQAVIGFGTVACLCCVLFLGLKLKWFRAQFKLEDKPKSKKSADTVQGIGFKVKTNADGYQRYKSVSEFATPAVTVTKQYENRNATILNEIKSNTFAKVESKQNVIKAEKKTSIVSSEQKQATKKEAKSDELQVQETRVKKVSFVKQETIINDSSTYTQEEKIDLEVEIEKPMRVAAGNIVMPQADEDTWHETSTPTPTPRLQLDDSFYFTNNNNSSSTATVSSMYSSQAASIFFESYEEKQAPDSPPPPIPRKFLEDNDNTSINSQTSA